MSDNSNTTTEYIFKHVLLRIAGESYNVFDLYGKDLTRNKSAIHNLVSLEKERSSLVFDMCDILFVLINTVEDQYKKKLINFKREVLSSRKGSKVKDQSIICLFSDEMIVKHDRFLQVNQEIDELKATIHNYYLKLSKLDTEIVRYMCSSEKFLNGLLLSSEVLFDHAKSYGSRKKEIDESTLIGLWKYCARVITKTTPFSTFTQLNTACLSDKFETFTVTSDLPALEISALKYNNYILEKILSILRNHSIYRKFLFVKKNSTILDVDDSYIFFTNNHNIESIQTLVKNESISTILASLESSSEITFRELVYQLSGDEYENIGNFEIVDFISLLVQTGFLELVIDSSCLDGDWDISLEHFFAKISSEYRQASEVCNRLQKLSRYRNYYNDCDSDGRRNVLIEMRKIVEALFVDLRENIETVENGNISVRNWDINEKVFLHKVPKRNEKIDIKNFVYEDTTLDIKIEINKKKVEDFVGRIRDILSAFTFLHDSRQEQNIYYYFFKDKYDDREKVSLMKFYEDYNKSISIDNTRSNNYNDYFRYVQLRYSGMKSEVLKFIADEGAAGSIIFKDDVCNIDRQFLDNLNTKFAKYNSLSKNQELCYGAFVQFVFDQNSNGDFSGICTSILPGYGRMMSRFLHLFDEEIIQDLKKWNKESLGKDMYYAENNDASFFNANIHAPIMPFEIQIPGGNARANTRLLNISELFVAANDENRELELFSKSGRRVMVFDLGFQNPLHRSVLFRILNAFGHNIGYPLSNVVNLFNDIYARYIVSPEITSKIRISPRIIFDNCLILQRKKWSIPITEFVSLLKECQGRKLDEIYVEIQKWRINLFIPDEVFVKVVYFNNQGNLESSNKSNKDDYKPQYINFVMPISVSLFVKIIRKVTNGEIVLEEMLPTSDNLQKIGEQKYAIEALVQWYQ